MRGVAGTRSLQRFAAWPRRCTMRSHASMRERTFVAEKSTLGDDDGKDGFLLVDLHCLHLAHESLALCRPNRPNAHPLHQCASAVRSPRSRGAWRHPRARNIQRARAGATQAHVDDSAEDDVFPVQVRGGLARDEELRAIRVRPCTKAMQRAVQQTTCNEQATGNMRQTGQRPADEMQSVCVRRRTEPSAVALSRDNQDARGS